MPFDYSQIDPNWETSTFLIIVVIAIFGLPSLIKLVLAAILTADYIFRRYVFHQLYSNILSPTGDFIYTILLQPIWYFLHDAYGYILYALIRASGWVSASSFLGYWTPVHRGHIIGGVALLSLLWLSVGTTVSSGIAIAGAVIVPALSSPTQFFAFTRVLIPVVVGVLSAALTTAGALKIWSWLKSGKNVDEIWSSSFSRDEDEGANWIPYIPGWSWLTKVKDSSAEQFENAKDKIEELTDYETPFPSKTGGFWDSLKSTASYFLSSPNPPTDRIIDTILIQPSGTTTSTPTGIWAKQFYNTDGGPATENSEASRVSHTVNAITTSTPWWRFTFNSRKQDTPQILTAGVIEKVSSQVSAVASKVSTKTRKVQSMVTDKADSKVAKPAGFFGFKPRRSLSKSASERHSSSEDSSKDAKKTKSSPAKKPNTTKFKSSTSDSLKKTKSASKSKSIKSSESPKNRNGSTLSGKKKGSPESTAEKVFKSIKSETSASQPQSPFAGEEGFSPASETLPTYGSTRVSPDGGLGGAIHKAYSGRHMTVDAFDAVPIGDFGPELTGANSSGSAGGAVYAFGTWVITGLFSLGHGFKWLFSNTIERVAHFYNSSTVESATSDLAYCTTCWIPMLLYISLGLFVLWGAAPVIDRFISRNKRRPFTLIATAFSFATWVPALITIFAAWTFQAHSEITEWLYAFRHNRYLLSFTILALWKGIRIAVHTFSYYFFTYPAQSPSNPTILPSDVTVIVPTNQEFGNAFMHSIVSILANRPASVIIATSTLEYHQEAIRVCARIDPKIKVVSILEPNIREQFIHAANTVTTPIIAYVKEDVTWPETFLRSSLAPFEDPIVGVVGTVGRPIRWRGATFLNSFFNYIFCINSERFTFENTASYNLDGGVSVIPGHSALVRTEIIHSLEYRHGFLNECWLGIGPFDMGDDHFTTRFMVNTGYKTVFHNQPDAIVETVLPYFVHFAEPKEMLLTDERMTWRNNLTSLIARRVCWWSYPWTTYAMLLNSLVNFALFYDSALVYALYKATGTEHLCPFLFVLFLSKLIKPFPYLWRNPRDVRFLFGGILFGYVHSLIKLCALFTVWKKGYGRS